MPVALPTAVSVQDTCPLPTAVAAVVCGGVQPSVVLYEPQILIWASELLSAHQRGASKPSMKGRPTDHQTDGERLLHQWPDEQDISPSYRSPTKPATLLLADTTESISSPSGGLGNGLDKQEGVWQTLSCYVLIFSASAYGAAPNLHHSPGYKELQACIASSTGQQLLVPPPPVHPHARCHRTIVPNPGE